MFLCKRNIIMHFLFLQIRKHPSNIENLLHCQYVQEATSHWPCLLFWFMKQTFHLSPIRITLPQRAASWRAVPRAVLTLMSRPTRRSSSTTLQSAATTLSSTTIRWYWQTWCVHSCWRGAALCECRSSIHRPCTSPPVKLSFTNHFWARTHVSNKSCPKNR